MALVTLATAKDQLEIDTSDIRDEMLRLRIEMAEAIVLDYLEITDGSPQTWTNEADTPPVVLAAILLMLGHLHAHRGDDAAGTFRTPGEGVWKEIDLLLKRYRQSVIA